MLGRRDWIVIGRTKPKGKAMRVRGTICLIMLTTGCVSLPSIEAQKAATARQNFGEDYEFSITSHYEDAVVTKSSSEAILASYQPDARQFIIERLAKALESYPRGLGWLSGRAVYNRGDFPSDIEEDIANVIATSLQLKPVYIPRSLVTERIGITDSAMTHAKAIAAENNYNAVSVIYFKPILTKTNASFGESNPLTAYTLSYETHFAVRSVPNDELMYSNITTHYCADATMGGTREGPIDDYEKMAACEREITSAIAGRFIHFAQEARSNSVP